MIRRVLAAGVVLLTGVIALLAAPGPALAHSGSTYYPRLWSTDPILYGFHNTFPYGEIRLRTFQSHGTWNQATIGDNHPFFWGGLPDANYGSAQKPCNVPGTNNRGAIFWNNLDYLGVSVAAMTRVCYSGSTNLSFTIEFDNTMTWHTGSGAPPANRFDFASYATHEFGHATGFVGGGEGGHLPEADQTVCPETPLRNTMCAGYAGLKGTTWYRTLGAHDIHTLIDAYY